MLLVSDQDSCISCALFQSLFGRAPSTSISHRSRESTFTSHLHSWHLTLSWQQWLSSQHGTVHVDCLWQCQIHEVVLISRAIQQLTPECHSSVATTDTRYLIPQTFIDSGCLLICGYLGVVLEWTSGLSCHSQSSDQEVLLSFVFVLSTATDTVCLWQSLAFFWLVSLTVTMFVLLVHVTHIPFSSNVK